MKRRFPAAFLILLLTACTGPQVLSPVAPNAESEIRSVCAAPFPRNRWQLVHSIETDFGGGYGGMMLGVTVIDPESRILQSAMMTIEGLVVFNAESTPDQLSIERAVPPFDSNEFARGVMEDIRLMFFPPQGPVTVGNTEAGRPICRFETGPNRILDIRFDPESGWVYQLYRAGKLVRTVHADVKQAVVSPAGKVIPRRMTLTGHGSPEYTLHLKLLEAKPLANSLEQDIISQ